jgi:fermentation-respiration switch protein FrsA (DUF1100 family)
MNFHDALLALVVVHCARAPMPMAASSGPSFRRRESCSSVSPATRPPVRGPAPTSYAPPPGAPYSAEVVVVTTPAGLRLAGTITRPASRPGEAALARAARVTDSLTAAPGWLHFFADYDPLVTARRVRAPTLILQGQTDRHVSPEQAATLAEAMRAAGNRRVVVRSFPRMNHLMLDDPSGSPRG